MSFGFHSVGGLSFSRHFGRLDQLGEGSILGFGGIAGFALWRMSHQVTVSTRISRIIHSIGSKPIAGSPRARFRELN